MSVQDYELQLASYSAGLETLLNIPIKRTMLKSPATTVRQEVGAPLIQHQFTLTHQQGAAFLVISYREFTKCFHVICIICSILYLIAKMWCVETLLTIW